MTASLATPTELVWNKGIAALCDWRIPDEFPQGRYSQVSTEAGSRLTSKTPDNLIGNPHLFSGIREGDLVWVRLAWLKSFIAQALPFVRENFILVTGDSDTTVPSEVSVAEQIIRHPRILHWYTQNYDGHYSKKISPIPIGIDFHTLSERAFWERNVRTALRRSRPCFRFGSVCPLWKIGYQISTRISRGSREWTAAWRTEEPCISISGQTFWLNRARQWPVRKCGGTAANMHLF